MSNRVRAVAYLVCTSGGLLLLLGSKLHQYIWNPQLTEPQALRVYWPCLVVGALLMAVSIIIVSRKET